MRGRYLFDFARICYMGAPQVDVLRYMDFILYILHIEAYLKEMAKEVKP